MHFSKTADQNIKQECGSLGLKTMTGTTVLLARACPQQYTSGYGRLFREVYMTVHACTQKIIVYTCTSVCITIAISLRMLSGCM